MKRTAIIFTALCLLLALPRNSAAQEVSSQAEIIAALSEAGAAIRSLECDFVQLMESSLIEGEVRSSGKMYFSEPSKLRWEYLEPEPGAFVLNADKALTINAKGRSELNANTNRMVKGLSSMILGSISGSSLSDQRNFKVSIEEKDGEWVATLIPQRKDLRQMWSSIVIRFDKNSKCARGIVLNEPGGDRTVIEFSKVKLNGAIAEELFSTQP